MTTPRISVSEAFKRSGPEWTVEMVERFFRHAIRKEKITSIDTHFAATQFLGAIRGDPYGLSHFQDGPPSKEEKEARIRRVVQLFLDGVRRR